MAEYYVSNCDKLGKEHLIYVFGEKSIVEDWEDGTFNIKIPEERENGFLDWCEIDNIQVKLI